MTKPDQSTADQAHIMQPEAISAKPKELTCGGERPKKLLGQVSACPELAEGMPSVSSTTRLATSNGWRRRNRGLRPTGR